MAQRKQAHKIRGKIDDETESRFGGIPSWKKRWDECLQVRKAFVTIYNAGFNDGREAARKTILAARPMK